MALFTTMTAIGLSRIPTGKNSSPSTDYMSDIYTYYMAQIIGSAGNGDRKGVSGSYGRNKFSPSSTGQIFTYSVFDEGYVDTDAVGKGWFVTDSCGIK